MIVNPPTLLEAHMLLDLYAGLLDLFMIAALDHSCVRRFAAALHLTTVGRLS